MVRYMATRTDSSIVVSFIGISNQKSVHITKLYACKEDKIY